MHISFQWSSEQALCKSLGPQEVRAVREVPVPSEKVMQWHGMHKTMITGTNIFTEQTVNGENYRRMFCYYAMS